MRCFIAVELPPELRRELSKLLQDAPKTGLRKVSEENIHITLRFLGELTEDEVKKVSEALKGLEGFGSFEVTVTLPGHFGGRVLWIGVGSEKLHELKKTVDLLVKASLGLPPETSFIPHITLARIKKPSARSYLTKFLKKKAPEASFTVAEVKLKKSILTPEGPIYEDLEVIRL